MIDRNSIMTGIVVGAIVPVLGFVVTEFVFEMLTQFNLMEAITPSASNRRMRTLTLIALCYNLIPFNISKKYCWEETMRGMVIPTIIYAGAWIYMFREVLFYN